MQTSNFTTLDQKDKVYKPFKGDNVKAFVTSDINVLEHSEYSNLSYNDILAFDDTTIIDIQAELWGEPLANSPKKGEIS